MIIAFFFFLPSDFPLNICNVNLSRHMLWVTDLFMSVSMHNIYSVQSLDIARSNIWVVDFLFSLNTNLQFTTLWTLCFLSLLPFASHFILPSQVFFIGGEPINERKWSMRSGYSSPMHWSQLDAQRMEEIQWEKERERRKPSTESGWPHWTLYHSGIFQDKNIYRYINVERKQKATEFKTTCFFFFKAEPK